MSSSPPTSPRFDPLVKAVARKAESIYSKMGIRRDESEDLGRKKKGPSDEDLKSIPWEDTTDVSVIALRGFLEDLLGLSHDQSFLPAAPSIPAPAEPVHPPTSASSAAAHAASAYRHTGLAVHDQNLQPEPISLPASPTPAPPDSGVTLGGDFGEEERAQLLGYLNELASLQQKGVETLSLRRSLTFLESIHQAIELAK